MIIVFSFDFLVLFVFICDSSTLFYSFAWTHNTNRDFKLNKVFYFLNIIQNIQYQNQSENVNYWTDWNPENIKKFTGKGKRTTIIHVLLFWFFLFVFYFIWLFQFIDVYSLLALILTTPRYKTHYEWRTIKFKHVFRIWL